MSRDDLMSEESEALVLCCTLSPKFRAPAPRAFAGLAFGEGAAGGRVAGVFPAYRDLAAEGVGFCLGMMFL